MDYLSDRSDPDNDIDNIPPEEEFIDSTDSTDGEDGDNVSDWDRGRVSEAHNTIILERQEELPRSIDSLFKKGLLDKKGEMGSTILHLITERWSKTNRSGSDLAELFKAVMEKCPRLFLEKDDLGKSILNRSSMRKKKSNFAQFFIYEYPDKTEELVREDPDILKLMVASSMELDIWKALLGRLGKSAGKLLLRCDEGGNTFIHNILRNIDHGPFHVALPHIILEIIRAAPDSLKTLNDEGKSLYGCFIEGMNKRTESSELRMRKESALPASHDSRTMTEKSSRLSEKYFDGPKISPTGKIFDNPKMDNPPSRRPEKYSDDPKMNISSSRLLPDPKDNAKSAAQTSQPVVRKRAKEPKPEETEELVNHILAEVKEVLLREMYRGLGEMEIHSLLHPYTSEIDVDLLELEKSRDPIQTLKGILEPLPLEPFLRSVRLPYFRTDLAARTDIYFEILGTLNSHGVRRIMRLEVDEAIDCPSSDDTITKAASGFHIEEWDWRKTDIDTGVLCKVAPEARKLYLYSSGNFPVLKHWSSDEGLAMFKNLEEVSLIVFSKIETPQTTEDCVREFRMRMDKACPKIEFKVRHFKPSFEGSRSWSWLLQGDQGRLIETAKGPNPKTLTERFERLTRHLEPCFDKPSIDVKVSIIDDGIDPVEIGNRIGGGISFAHYPGEHSRLKPYYFSSNGRGTALAHIMLRLCAQLKFYVARVDIEQRSLTPIVQAINWAAERDVAIILLGSSPDLEGGSQEQLKNYEKAIDTAMRRGIQIFIPVADFPTSNLRTFRREGIIEIAATSHTGVRSQMLEPDLPFTIPIDMQTLDQLSEDSMATGFAAGIAALLLCCVRAYKTSDLAQDRISDRLIANIQRPRTMMKLFKRMQDSEHSKNISAEELLEIPKYRGPEEAHDSLEQIISLISKWLG